MSDITGVNPDYTDEDLAILSTGAWDSGEEAESVDRIEADSVPEVAPENPWQQDSQAKAYAESMEEAEPMVATGAESISRVELQPGGVKAAIEAILAVADTPVSVRELSATLIVSESAIEAALDDLYRDYNGFDDGEVVHEPRGFELRRLAGGWRLYSRSDFSPWVSRFVVEKTSAKLPKAAMETLAVVAYRQPVTRGYVASVRGVSVDAAFRTLLQRGLITETDQDPETGAKRYITTGFFMEKLGLDSLDQLPPLAPYLPDADDIELASGNP